jgi:hypothetical protein
LIGLKPTKPDVALPSEQRLSLQERVLLPRAVADSAAAAVLVTGLAESLPRPDNSENEKERTKRSYD